MCGVDIGLGAQDVLDILSVNSVRHIPVLGDLIDHERFSDGGPHVVHQRSSHSQAGASSRGAHSRAQKCGEDAQRSTRIFFCFVLCCLIVIGAQIRYLVKIPHRPRRGLVLLFELVRRIIRARNCAFDLVVIALRYASGHCAGCVLIVHNPIQKSRELIIGDGPCKAAVVVLAIESPTVR